MKVHQVIEKLEELGYKLNLRPGPKVDIKLKPGEPKPDPAEVKPLFERLKEKKSVLVRELKNREMLNPVPDWFIMRSHLLDGEKILIRRDEDIKIPYKYRDLESYTFLEGKLLLADDITLEGLKTLHKARKMFDGTLIFANPGIIKKDSS